MKHLAHGGHSRREIARALGCSAATIHRRLRELA
ncbi:MAG: helix-turn-helix domain-containing protein [Burkholderiales bacterium]